MSEPEPSERPASLPADAKWEPSQVPGFEWKQYALDDDGNKHGLSRSWTREGVLHAETTYVHGKKQGANKTFHPDGSVSSIGEWRDDALYDCVYYRSDAPSTEPWPGDAGKTVRSVGYYSTDGKTNYTIRYFDATNTEVALDGSPLPPRPEGVPATARWFPDLKQWVDGAMARANNKQVGTWRWWNADGGLRHEEERDDRGDARVVTDFHANGGVADRRSKPAEGGELWEVFHANGQQKIKKVTDAKKRVHYMGRWGDDGGMWDEQAIAYDGDAIVSVTERDSGGVLAFEARREGSALAMRLYDGGKLAATGMWSDGQLAGTWQLFEGERVRREIEVTAKHRKPTAEGLVWRLAEAVYAADEPTFESPDQLRGVDDVAWGELETAYGSADGFARFLRGVVAKDPYARLCAGSKLGSQIEHQGSTYPASAAVIPWLAKLLTHPDVDRLAIVRMIRSLADAALPYLDECSPDDDYWPAIGGVIEAVRAAWPQIFATFATGDAALRREVVVVARAVPTASAELREVARRDGDAAMRACAIDALVAVKGYALDDVLPSLSDEDPLVKAAAAIAIARTRGPETPEAVVAALGEVLRGWRAIADRWSALPYTRQHVLADLAIATGSVRTPAARALASQLCAGLDEVDGQSALGYGQGLLALALGKGEHPFAPAFVDILATVTRSRKFWAFNVNAVEVLDLWKLPRAPQALENLIVELRAASDPEAHLRAKLGITEPSDAPEEKPEPEPEPEPEIDAKLAEVVRLADKANAAEVYRRADAVAFARALIDAVRDEDRQQAAQHVEQIAGEALRVALDGEQVDTALAAIADDLLTLGRSFDRRVEWSRVWPISEAHAEPALFALAAGRYERAEQLAREQLRDPRVPQADNHLVQIVFARAAAGQPPAADIVLADPKVDTRTYHRIWTWLAKQPLEIVERILAAVPPETQLELLVGVQMPNVYARVSQPLARVIAALEAVRERIADGILPATVGGATSPLSDLLWVDGKLRWFFKKYEATTDEERRLVGRGWQLYAYLVCASQRSYDPKYVGEAIEAAKQLGIADADWVADVIARLDRDTLDDDTRARAATLLPRVARGGAILGRSLGGLCEKALPERARERLLELTLEHAPALAWPVLAAMADGAQRWRATKLALACPDVPGAFHALRLLGDGEILNRLAQDAKTERDVAVLAARARGWLAILQLSSQRYVADRVVDYAEALLARDDLVAHLAATEADHVVWRGFSLARQPLAVVLAYAAQRALRDQNPTGAIALCKVGMRFPRGRGEPARVLLGIADVPFDVIAATAGMYPHEPATHLAREQALRKLARTVEAAREHELAIAAGADPIETRRC